MDFVNNRVCNILLAILLLSLLFFFIVSASGCTSSAALQRLTETGEIPEGIDGAACWQVDASAGGSITNFSAQADGCLCETWGNPREEVIQIALDKCRVGENAGDSL